MVPPDCQYTQANDRDILEFLIKTLFTKHFQARFLFNSLINIRDVR